MIVAPDFLDNWKTVMLCDLLQDQTAPFLILRLWSHCQLRKTDVIEDYSPDKLKALCRYPGDAGKLDFAMRAAPWIHVEGTTATVHGFREYNASLFAAWENGNKGGRPRKALPENPRVTHGKPTGNPRKTQGVTDREDWIGVDGPSPQPPEGAGTVAELPEEYAELANPERIAGWLRSVHTADPTTAQLACWKAAVVDLATRHADPQAIVRGLRWYQSADPKYRGKPPSARDLTADWFLALAAKSADQRPRAVVED